MAKEAKAAAGGKAKRRPYTVTLAQPAGVSDKTMREFIAEAVRSRCEGLPEGDPLRGVIAPTGKNGDKPAQITVKAEAVTA